MKFLVKLLLYIKTIKVYIMIIGICLGIFTPIILFSKPIRVGDGSEYYAMAIAWSSTHKPFMSEKSWQLYNSLVDSEEIENLLNVTKLAHQPPAVKIGETADFNHFWFYSFLASVVYKATNFLWPFKNSWLSIHQAFLLLHCFLLSTASIIAWHYYRWQGLLAIFVLTFFSPILWFIDKVHTEFFTFCTTTSSVILFLKRRYILSSFFLGLSATQNISFAAVSLFLLILDLFARRRDKYTLDQVVILIMTVALIVLHPVYYYFRFGVFTPQLFIGGARIGVNWKYAYIWFIDPDIGLFPNWPMGFILLTISFIALVRRKTPRNMLIPWLGYVSTFILMSLWAQSSTENLNHGGTPGISRYSLWYLGLFYPSIVFLVNHVKNSKWHSTVLVCLSIACFVYNFNVYNLTLPEEGWRPSKLSALVQTYLPKLYNPPPEIFIERYCGVPSCRPLFAVIGPDCHKVLITNTSPNNNESVLGWKGCGLDFKKVAGIIKYHLSKGTWPGIVAPAYVELSSSDVEKSKFITFWNQWYAITSDYSFDPFILNENMSKGWSPPESWGIWTNGNIATLAIRCPSITREMTGNEKIEFELHPFVAPNHSQVYLTIKVDHIISWSGELEKDETVQVDFPDRICTSNSMAKVEFVVENPTSPYNLGLSSDKRLLGIGLKRLRYVK